MTSVLRPRLIFLNNHIFFILRELMLLVVEARIDVRRQILDIRVPYFNSLVSVQTSSPMDEFL